MGFTQTTMQHADNLSITEILAANVAMLVDKSIVHQSNTARQLNSASAVPVTKAASIVKALAAGVGTIDLTALPGAGGGTVDGTGLKVQLAKFANPSTHAITVKFGAANPYLLGGTNWTFTVQPGGELVVYANKLAPDIASGAKSIDLVGTLTDTLDCIFAMG